jgi:hypothetical protein
MRYAVLPPEGPNAASPLSPLVSWETDAPDPPRPFWGRSGPDASGAPPLPTGSDDCAYQLPLRLGRVDLRPPGSSSPGWPSCPELREPLVGKDKRLPSTPGPMLTAPVGRLGCARRQVAYACRGQVSLLSPAGGTWSTGRGSTGPDATTASQSPGLGLHESPPAPGL